jgi:hypothetical protein
MGNAVIADTGTAGDAGQPSIPRTSGLSRWRDGVANGMFGVSEPATTSRSRMTGWYLAAFAASVGYLLLIPAGRARLTHIWAEDGWRFLADARSVPFGSALVTPYGGYLHVVPRIAAELVSHLPLTWAAAGLAVAAAMARAAIALLVFAASGGILRYLPVRFALAALVVVIPAGNAETLNNISNLHWFALYGAFWLLWWRPASRWVAVVAAVAAFLTATTDPTVLLLAPLALARFALPGRRQAVITGGFLLGAAAQAAAVLLATRVPYSNTPVDVKAAVLAGLLRVPLVAFTSSEDTALIYRAFHYWPAILALVVALGVAAVAVRWGATAQRVLPLVALAYCVLFISLDLSENWTRVMYADRPGVVLDAQRYSVAPCLFLLTAVAVGLDRVPRPAWRRAGSVVVAAILLTGVVRQLPVASYRPTGPAWDQSVAAAKEQCAQGGSFATLPLEPSGWTVQLDCGRLG